MPFDHSGVESVKTVEAVLTGSIFSTAQRVLSWVFCAKLIRY